MKNIILLSAILFYSQVLFAQDFVAELLLGANFSQVDGDQLGGYNKLGANSYYRSKNDGMYRACFE